MSVHSRGLPELCLEYFWLHGKVTMTMLIKAKKIIDIVVIFIIYLSVEI